MDHYIPTAKLKQVSTGELRELSHTFASFEQYAVGDTLHVIEWDALNVKGGSDHYVNVRKINLGEIPPKDTFYQRNVMCDYQRYTAILIAKK